VLGNRPKPGDVEDEPATLASAPLDHELFHTLYDIREVPQIPSIGFWLGTGGQTSERSDSREVHVRAILGNIGVTVLPDQVAISKAYEAFGPDGSLLDAKQATKVKSLGAQLAQHLAKLQA